MSRAAKAGPKQHSLSMCTLRSLSLNAIPTCNRWCPQGGPTSSWRFEPRSAAVSRRRRVRPSYGAGSSWFRTGWDVHRASRRVQRRTRSRSFPFSRRFPSAWSRSCLSDVETGLRSCKRHERRSSFCPGIEIILLRAVWTDVLKKQSHWIYLKGYIVQRQRVEIIFKRAVWPDYGKTSPKRSHNTTGFLLKSYIVQNGPKSFHFWATFVGEFVTKAPPKLVQSGYFAEERSG